MLLIFQRFARHVPIVRLLPKSSKLVEAFYCYTQISILASLIFAHSVDFQKAFHFVSHQKLFINLEGYGIHGDLLAWLKAFLSDGCFSDPVYIMNGVPQGSVLGPTLFLQLLPPTKEEVHVFPRVCLSVCPLARLLKNACMNLDEMLRADRCRDIDELLNF